MAWVHSWNPESAHTPSEVCGSLLDPVLDLAVDDCRRWATLLQRGGGDSRGSEYVEVSFAKSSDGSAVTLVPTVWNNIFADCDRFALADMKGNILYREKLFAPVGRSTERYTLRRITIKGQVP